MNKIKIIVITLILSAILSVAGVSAQTPAPAQKLPDIGITKTLALGEVTALSAADKTLSLKTRDGDIVVTLADTTEYKKASLESPADLSKATPSALTDIGVGDRLIASGKIAEDKKTMISRTIILMTKGDISKLQQSASEAWAKGINGKVTAINPIAKEITVTMRGMMGERAVVMSTGNAVFRRYAPNSIKYSDAVGGSYDDVKTGDQLRARGTRSEDGAHFTADEVISGTFRTAAGKITAIDVAKNEVTIDDVVSKKPLTISLGDTTTLRKFPAEMAQMFAMRQMGMGAGGGQTIQLGQGGQGAQGAQRTGVPPGVTPNGVQPAAGTANTQGGQSGQGGQGGAPGQPGQGRPGGGQGGQGGMRMGGGGGNLDEMLERLPAITLAELKVGESIAVSSTPGQTPGHVSAIKLLAGVEPFLNMPAMSMPQGAGRQSSPSINIPGLDGIGSP